MANRGWVKLNRITKNFTSNKTKCKQDRQTLLKAKYCPQYP